MCTLSWEGIDPLSDFNTPNVEVGHHQSPPVAIPLRDYLPINPNFLERRSNSSLSIDSYSSGWPVSYTWEILVANPLHEPFSNLACQPPTYWTHQSRTSSPDRSDLEDGPGTSTNPTFHDEVKKVTNFEVKSSFKRNYKIIVPSPTDVVSDPPWVALRCIWRP